MAKEDDVKKQAVAEYASLQLITEKDDVEKEKANTESTLDWALYISK